MQVQPAQLHEAVKEPNMRVSLALTRFLAFTNGLEAFTAIAAIAWATGLWIGHHGGKFTPADVSLLAAPMLALIGIVSLIALVMGWRRIRTAGSLLAFQCWAVLAALLWTDNQLGSSAVGLYAAMAIAELALYVRTKLELDVRGLQVGCQVQANLAAARCGLNVSGGKDDAR